MRSQLEKALTALINEDRETADALFHDFILERSRQIHESLRQGDDFILDENWEKSINIDEMFSEADLSEDDDMEGDDMGMTEADDDSMEPTEGGEEEVDVVEPLAGEEEVDVEEPAGDLETRVDDLQAQLQALAAEFDAQMGGTSAEDAISGVEGDEDDMANADEDEDDLTEGTLEIVQNGETGELDLTHHVDGGADMDMGMGAPMGDDMGMDMGDDLGDDEGDDFDDLSESAVDDLMKVKVDHAEGKSTGGDKFKPNTVSPALSKPVDKRQAGEPVKIKSTEHKGFERETPPSAKTMEKRQNTKAHAKDGQSGVKKEGDKSAILNTLGSDDSAKSIIAGK